MLFEIQAMATEMGMTGDMFAYSIAIDMLFFGLFLGRKRETV